MARWAVLLLLVATVGAGEIDSAKGLLAKYDVESRKQGLALVLQIDNERAVDVLIGALRRTYKEDKGRERTLVKALDKSTKKLQRLIDRIDKLMAAGNVLQSRDEAHEIFAAMADENKDIDAALRAYAPHELMLVEGRTTLGKFQARDAWQRIEEVAKLERAGPIRDALLQALARHGSPESIPTFVELTEDRDARARALAVRALRKHANDPAVLARLEACAEDEEWQVRRGAYAALGQAPDGKGIETLKKARERETGDQVRWIDRELHRLEAGPEPEAAPAVAFGLPLTSRRVLFVLDLSEDIGIEFVRDELVKALEALPDGAMFEIAGHGVVDVRFATKPTEMSASARTRAIAWARKLKARGASDMRALFNLLLTDYDDRYAGKRVFAQLPDALYLVCRGAEQDDLAMPLARFALWNRPCDATLHVRVMKGDKYPCELLQKVAEATHGTFVK
jgi:hypothetical protein